MSSDAKILSRRYRAPRIPKCCTFCERDIEAGTKAWYVALIHFGSFTTTWVCSDCWDKPNDKEVPNA